MLPRGAVHHFGCVDALRAAASDLKNTPRRHGIKSVARRLALLAMRNLRGRISASANALCFAVFALFHPVRWHAEASLFGLLQSKNQ
ncbi:MAG: hypothetical protein ACEQSK_04395 [Sphingomonadaceae bacterium]